METPAVDRFPDRSLTLLEDGDFVLRRSRDLTDPTSPSRSVLVVMPRSEHPRPQAVRMLDHEYSLRHVRGPLGDFLHCCCRRLDRHGRWAFRRCTSMTTALRPRLDPGVLGNGKGTNLPHRYPAERGASARDSRRFRTTARSMRSAVRSVASALPVCLDEPLARER